LFTALVLFITDFTGVKEEQIIKVPADLVARIDIEHRAYAGLMNPNMN
jgi:hypothetical protein